MSTQLVEKIPVIDADTHLVEPPDLWTSRMSSKWGDLVPHVVWDEQNGDEAWFIGDQRVSSVGGAAMAGWSEYPPDHPKRWGDTDPATWDASVRLKKMDEYGIHAQVLYPNVALFNSSLLVDGRRGLTLEFLRAYNDYQTDWSSAAPDRLLPMTSLPFWNLDATLAEIERCTAMGHRGIVFSQDPSAFGLPALTDPHWDPMWASAQEKGLPVNFHIASGDISLFTSGGGLVGAGPHANYASMGVSFFMGNARTISVADLWRDLPPLPGAQLRVRRERHRLDPVRPRLARLAVEELRRRPRASRVRPVAERVLQAADVRVLLVRARDRPGRHRVARRRQLPLRDRLPAPDEHVARPGHERGLAARLHREQPRRPARVDAAQDPPRQRRPHLPPRLMRTARHRRARSLEVCRHGR